MKKPFRIKRKPKEINKEVKQKYVEKNYLKVNLDTEISPLQDLVIKLYYYNYIKYIAQKGMGNVFFQQLEDYMEIVHKENIRRTRKMVNEMESFGLIKKKNNWNSIIIHLTKPSLVFFNKENKGYNYTIGKMIKTTFKLEHFNKYEPENRETYEIKGKEYLLKDSLKDLKESNIVVENIKKDEEKTIITFAYLNVSSYINKKSIMELIQKINSLFKLDTLEKVYFNLNVCLYDEHKTKYIESKWKKEDSYINSDKFLEVKFTNLDIKRFFTHSAERS